MPTHDIIDNHNEKLVDHIKRILGSAVWRGARPYVSKIDQRTGGPK
jgi:hypothetical protein